MTFPEYLYRMKAFNLSRVDKQRDMHYQALLNRDAQATKKKGDKEVYVYGSLDDFFDYKKAIETIDKPKAQQLNTQHKRMAQIAANLNK